jgi:hypothetical protein
MARGETLSDKKARGKPMSVEKVDGNDNAKEGILSVRKEKESNPVKGKAREGDNKKNSKRKRKLKQTGSPS